MRGPGKARRGRDPSRARRRLFAPAVSLVMLAAMSLFVAGGTEASADVLEARGTTSPPSTSGVDGIDVDDALDELRRRVEDAVEELTGSESEITPPELGSMAPSVGPEDGSAVAPARSGARPAARDRPRIDVDKTNDADGNGSFSRDEMAPRPGADVTFEVEVGNFGTRDVTIRRITDEYDSRTIDVCESLVGERIRPGRSVGCTFTLQDYAPPRYEGRANTVTVTAEESRGNRRVSGSGVSTVTTGAGSAEVLGAGVTNPNADEPRGVFASTGFYLVPVVALAAALMGAGTGLLGLARRRGRLTG